MLVVPEEDSQGWKVLQFRSLDYVSPMQERDTRMSVTPQHRQQALYYLAGCALQCSLDERNDRGFREACATLHKELTKQGQVVKMEAVTENKADCQGCRNMFRPFKKPPCNRCKRSGKGTRDYWKVMEEE